MKEIKWSATNDPAAWSNEDEGVIRFASQEDAQKMMRFLAKARPEAELRRIEIMGLKYWLHAVRTNMIRDGQDGVKLIQDEVHSPEPQSLSTTEKP